MKKYFGQFLLAAVLISLSAVLYYAHYLIFHEPHHIFIYLVSDIAFVPIEVLLVSLVIHRLLSIHEKKTIMRKLNMVIGTFFSEIGTELISIFAQNDSEAAALSDELNVKSDWTDKEFKAAARKIRAHKYHTDIDGQSMIELRQLLVEKRDFMLTLMANPNLLEHDKFTDLLWAVFHLSEELTNRTDVYALEGQDRSHVANDTCRAYKAAVDQWLSYMEHLKKSYPYLFSLAMRTNPFDPNASIEVLT